MVPSKGRPVGDAGRRDLVRCNESSATNAAPQRLGGPFITRSEHEKPAASFNAGSEVPAELDASKDGIVAIPPLHL